MPSEGPKFPGTVTSLANAGTSENAEAWVNPGNVSADDATEAAITAATFDSPDISELLVARNFGFSFPSDATVDGILVEIERRCSAGSASDNRVQLGDGATFASLVGANKADTALAWPSTATVKSYGGAADRWGTDAASLTVFEILASSFSVFLSVQADSANTDIQVDYVRVTVFYTEAGGGVNVAVSPVVVPMVVPIPTVAVGVIVAPDPVAIPLVIPTPTVSTGSPANVTPSPVAIPLVVPIPTVTVGVEVTPAPVAIPLVVPIPTVAAGGPAVEVFPDPVPIPMAVPTPTVRVGVIVTPSPVTVPLVVPAPSVAADVPFVPILPPLAAVGTAVIQVRVPVDTGFAEWDDAASDWDVSIWEEMQWVDRTPQSMNAQVSWGASDPNGFLAVAESGRFVVATYDPGRVLDPSNSAAPFAAWLRPGTLIRLRYIGGITRTIRTATIDTIDYSLIAKTGRITATDGISDLSAAIVPGQGAGELGGTTLTNRITFALEASKMDVTKPGGSLGGGSTAVVGAVEKEDTTAWFVITRAALDALRYVWVNRNGFILVRSMVTPFDSGVVIGGSGIPIADVETKTDMTGVLTRVIAYDEDNPEVPISAFAGDSYTLYGEIRYERKRPVPDASIWATAIVNDRSGDAIGKLNIGTLRPRTEAELDSLVDIGMGTLVTLHVDSITPPMDLQVLVLGGSFEANTTTGWSARFVGYVPDWGF